MQRLNFRPMLIDSLKGYTRQGLTRDLLAGLIVGIVALPMAIAFAIASGVSPEVGLVTAVLGGSSSQLSGVAPYRSGGLRAPSSSSSSASSANTVRADYSSPR